jgi:tetratricopeptide (TPR) repeat protein
MAGQPAPETETKPPQVFISYASEDRALAVILHGRLAAAGFSVWFDRARLNPGCDWHKEIEAGCEAARVILPVLTQRWQHSPWTKYETYASDAVIPVVAEGKPELVMPPPLRRWNAHALDPLTADDPAWGSLFAAIQGKLAEPLPERAPRILDLPYPANPFFTGRDTDLVRIHEELHEAPVAALTQGRVRALAAMGGVGKTTLANEYARRFWRLYRQILWVDARAGLESGFALLFEKLFPARVGEKLKQPDKARLALAELSGKQDRLLVIDNVEDAESVRPWLPRDAATGCRTLITSRFSDFSAAAGIRSIPLDVLEPEPSRRFLLTRTGRTAEGAELAACDELAKALGYLPLALEQAAAYVAAPGAGVGFAAYLRLYEAAAADLLARKALGSTEYPDVVITTWQTTVAKLSPESRAVLRLCAWYADTPIPRVLVMDGATEMLALAERFGPVVPLSGPAAAELRMRDALTGLARYSMILDATDATFRVHGLVQTVERVHAASEGNDAAIRDVALERLKIIFPDGVFNDPATWPLCRQLRPHVEALDKHLADTIANSSLADLLEATGRFLHGSGALREAETVLRRAIDKHEKSRGQDDITTAGCAHNLAHCLGDLGNLADSERLLRRALAVYETTIGMDHRNTLTCMNDLAVTSGKQGKFADAAEQLRRVLEHEERILGADHEATVRTLGNLAFCLGTLGDAAGALPLYRRALESRERVLGPEHPDTLSSVGSLAGCMHVLGDTAEALSLFRRELEGTERVLGADHPRTLGAVNGLAAGLRASGDGAGALALFRRALESRERVLGADHPDTLNSVNNLACCMQALGDTSGALPLYRRALDGLKRVLGVDHPDVVPIICNLATCMEALGNAAGALPLLQQALESREHMFGAEHRDTLISLNNLACCMQTLGDTAGALQLFRQAFETGERVLGAEHPNTLLFAGTLARCLDNLGCVDEAAPLHRRKVDGLERRLGAEHPNVLTACNNLAHSFRKAGRPDFALDYARRAADGSERVLAHDPSLILNRRGNLVLTLVMTGENSEVRRLLAGAWAWNAPDCANTTPRIAFIGLLADLLDGGNGAGAIGRLKQLLLGPELPMAASVAYPWDVGYLLDYLAPRLADGDRAFLTALLAAINDPDLAPALNRFPIWRDTDAVARDTPWPMTEIVAGGQPDGLDKT